MDTNNSIKKTKQKWHSSKEKRMSLRLDFNFFKAIWSPKAQLVRTTEHLPIFHQVSPTNIDYFPQWKQQKIMMKEIISQNW